MEDNRVESSVPENTSAQRQEIPEESAVRSTRSVGWRAVFKEALRQAQENQKPVATRRELGKDRSRSLLFLGLGAAALLLLFLGFFSSSQKPSVRTSGSRPEEPNLGRRQTPGEPAPEAGKSVAPLLSAEVRPSDTAIQGEVTADDVNRTADSPGKGQPPPAAITKQPADATRQYALSQIDPSTSTLPPAATPATANDSSAEQLKKPSLVFVRTAETTTHTNGNLETHVEKANSAILPLPGGTRLIARLESPASTAVRAPVVAVIEYSYERGGEIVIPAGTKAFGNLESASSSGYLGIHFDSIQMPDGTIEKVDANSMDLNFAPLKGKVTGKNTGKKFLVTALTGIGTAGALLFGSHGTGGLNGAYSEGDAVRNELASNVGNAGNQQLTNLISDQNIVVTLPGNIRFYLVFEKNAAETTGPGGLRSGTGSSAQAANGKLPSLEELRQLLQLRKELNQLYDQPGQAPATTSTASQP